MGKTCLDKKICPLCGQEITRINFTKHLRRHEKHPETFKSRHHLDHDDLKCKYCGKECKEERSLIQHEVRCKNNPDRVFPPPNFTHKGVPSWSKNLTADTCDAIKRQRETFQKNKALGLHHPSHRKHTAEEKERLRQRALKNRLGGFNMHKIKRVIDGKIVDSSYEQILAESLTENHIAWKRCSRFKYHDLTGKLHHYTPDFYLPDYDVYLDPKNDYLINNINPILGFKDLDKIQWVMNENNTKVIILDKDHLTWESIKGFLIN